MRWGVGLTDDQLSLLATIQHQGAPDEMTKGVLEAFRLYATRAQQDRIDTILRGPVEPPPAGTYEEHLAGARSEGVCPTCGRKR